MQNLVKHNQNNFDFLRFMAACLVIIDHSKLVGSGVNYAGLLTKNQAYLGELCVNIFFIISGYLITASYKNSNNVKKYIISRVLRIYPALIVVVLITTFIIGPLVCNVSLINYFSSKVTYSYLLNITIPFSEFKGHLPGFTTMTGGLFNDSINVSLWTLAWEVKCYIIIAVLGVVRLLNKRVVFIGFVTYIAIRLYHNADNSRFLTYFFTGSFFIYGEII